MTADEIVQGLEGVRRNGDGYMARCPAHEDRTPSLSVNDGDQGGVVLYCHAGCTTEAVCAALGLELRDLAPPSPDGSGNGRRRIVASYRYDDAHGDHQFDVVRYDPKDFRQRRPDGNGGWIWNLKGVTRVLYNLPAVVKTVQAGGAVWVCEGEKDADVLNGVLAEVGAVATTSPGGAGKWRSEYTEALRGGSVVIVSDRDDTGRAHAQHVAEQLEAVAASVCIVEPAEGKDASDHLAAGRALSEFVQRTFASKSVESVGGSAGEGRATDFDPVSVAPPPLPDLDAATIVPVEQFAAVDEPGAGALVGDGDEAVISEDGDVMVYGDGGAGKTTLCIDLGCHLGAGDKWLGIPIPKPRRVLLIENEGPRALYRRKLRRKLAGWTGSPLEGRVQVMEAPWAKVSFADESARQVLADAIRAHEFNVVIVGPVSRSGMHDAGTLQEVNAFMELVKAVRVLAGRPVTFVLIHHEGKSGKVSGAWEGSGDTLLHVTGQGPGRTRLYIQKARWASAYHAAKLNLFWTPGEGFAVEDKPEFDEADIAQKIMDEISGNPGTAWKPVEKAITGVGNDRLVLVRDRLLNDRQIVNVAKVDGLRVVLDHCPRGKTASLFPAGDPTVTQLAQDSGPVAGQSGPPWGVGHDEATGPWPAAIRATGPGPVHTPPIERGEP